MKLPELHKWQRDLSKFPSQIEYYFKDPKTNNKYCIYLRWRHKDPWTAELVKLTNFWDFSSDLSYWRKLEIGNYTHDDYLKLEDEVIKIIADMFPHIKKFKR